MRQKDYVKWGLSPIKTTIKLTKLYFSQITCLLGLKSFYIKYYTNQMYQSKNLVTIKIN